MGSQWGRDKVYDRARKSGYRSRAALKLKEILGYNPIIRQTDNIVDLGAAPGSWLQYLTEVTDGTIVGIDLNPILPVKGTTTIKGDFTDPLMIERVKTLMSETNVVVCDASPKLSGQHSYDQARAIELNEKALFFAVAVLKQGGNFLMKSFQGEDFAWIYRKVKEHFYAVKTFKTKTSRKGSTEIYIVARNFIGDYHESDKYQEDLEP